MAVSRTVFAIKRDVGRETPIFHIPYIELARSPKSPSNFCPKF